MAKKENAKEISSIPTSTPTVGAQTFAKRLMTQSSSFISIYANDIQVQTSPWDIRLILGQITVFPTVESPVVEIQNLGDLRMSVQMAKKLIAILQEQLAGYEMRFGVIPEPHD